MTTELHILTDEQITQALNDAGVTEYADVPLRYDLEVARAIEQAVLQSPEMQAMRMDADRYRHLRDQGELEPHDIFNAWWLSENGYPQTLDAAIDAAMERKA